MVEVARRGTSVRARDTPCVGSEAFPTERPPVLAIGKDDVLAPHMTRRHQERHPDSRRDLEQRPSLSFGGPDEAAVRHCELVGTRQRVHIRSELLDRGAQLGELEGRDVDQPRRSAGAALERFEQLLHGAELGVFRDDACSLQLADERVEVHARPMQEVARRRQQPERREAEGGDRPEFDDVPRAFALGELARRRRRAFQARSILHAADALDRDAQQVLRRRLVEARPADEAGQDERARLVKRASNHSRCRPYDPLRDGREEASRPSRRAHGAMVAYGMQNGGVLDPFPTSAQVEAGELRVGGLSASALADEFGTPLVVYCERTLLDSARSYLEAAPGALVVYSVKAFPSVPLLRLFGELGLGADVSTLGELEYALRAGIPGDRIVMHGNNKSDEELQASARARVGLVVLDALDEVDRAARAGLGRVLIRVTPGIEADTHAAVRTAHHGSKFGLPPEQALAAIRSARDAGLDPVGLHVHIGSQLLDTQAARTSVDWVAGFAADCRSELDWTPEVVDLGGGLGIQYVEDESPPAIGDFVRALRERVEHEWRLHGLSLPQLVLEPGRSLVGHAGLTLYRVGVVKQATETLTYVAIDGGMSDNPRPQLYGARYTALLANRAAESAEASYSVCGKHCESGDVLIERVRLPRPQRGDVLAVPGTGAYTLGMGSNYNGVPRPAAVLVGEGAARVIRRRETIDDLLALEA
jgi:diaminopimelate decarboxylase